MNQGATESDIASLIKWLGGKLPGCYLELMRLTNGLEGFISEQSYIILWIVQEVCELNEGYLAPEFAPGLLLIGTSGGDIGYAIDLRSSSTTGIWEVPLVGISLDDAEKVGNDFEDFFRYLIAE